MRSRCKITHRLFCENSQGPPDLRMNRCYGTSDSLRGRFSRWILWIDESSLLTGSTSTPIRSNMTRSYPLG
jgi:hypothetical protein